MDQDGQPPDREPAAPELREVDLIEATKIGLYQVGVIAEKRDERRQFPAMPTAF
jgi:hypothetical protein